MSTEYLAGLAPVNLTPGSGRDGLDGGLTTYKQKMRMEYKRVNTEYHRGEDGVPLNEHGVQKG